MVVSYPLTLHTRYTAQAVDPPTTTPTAAAPVFPVPYRSETRPAFLPFHSYDGQELYFVLSFI